MVDAADIQDKHVVVELGAGTGPFTKEISNRHPENPFLALEPRADLAAILRKDFPRLVVKENYAQDLPTLMDEWEYSKVDRVVSGLPWALWPKAMQDDILDGMLKCFSPQGRFVTFTYAHSGLMPSARVFRTTLRRRFKSVETTSIEWLNFPPAYAYICEQPR
jgi:phospholipid N-methyltransferase